MDPDLDTAESRAATPVARLDATIRGRVQGVGYRYLVLHRAMDLGLVGWVANTADGSVRCVVEGPRPALETLLETLAVGPAGALVERVLPTWSAPAGGFVSFEIRSGGHRGD
ncbi:MAG: acylphosphatase [Candidatus Limnocylindrales bacterium]